MEDPFECLTSPYGRLPVTRKDLATLDNASWVNDAVIMGYLLLLIEHRPEWAVIHPLVLASENSPSWTKIIERLRKQKNLAHLLLPMHCPGHWRLVVVSRYTATIWGYYSIFGDKAVKESLFYVRDVVVTQKLGWTENEWSVKRAKAPRQEDGHSCGAYILWWAKQLVEDVSATMSKPAANWRDTIKNTLLSQGG
jgi:Ulp1 family protease